MSFLRRRTEDVSEATTSDGRPAHLGKTDAKARGNTDADAVRTRDGKRRGAGMTTRDGIRSVA